MTGTSEGEGAGGLAGAVFGGTVIDSYATGHVTGVSVVGGLVGDVDDDGNRAGLHHRFLSQRGNVTGSGRATVGGLAGRVVTSTLDQVYATGNVSGVSACGWPGRQQLVQRDDSQRLRHRERLGGLVPAVGGLVGINVDGSTISNAYATGPFPDRFRSAGWSAPTAAPLPIASGTLHPNERRGGWGGRRQHRRRHGQDH